jgi:hypothetical protein
MSALRPRSYAQSMTTALARRVLPAAVLGATCGGAVRVLAESAARHPGALWLPSTDLNVVLLVGTLLVAMSALSIARFNRAAVSGWAWRGAVLAWPSFVLASALVAGPVWTVYLLGLPLLLVLMVGLLATRRAA